MKEISEPSYRIKEIFDSKNKEDIKNLLQEFKAADFAEALEDLEDRENLLKIFNLLDLDDRTEVFTYLEPETQEYLVDALTSSQLEQLVDDIYSDDLIDIIDDMPTESVQKILNSTTKEKRKELNDILKYEEETAGGIMSVNFVKFSRDATISQAIKSIRDNHDDFESVDDIFIVDEFGTLIGETKLKDLVVNPARTKLEKIMDTSVISTTIDTDQEEVVRIFKKYDMNTLPVIDEENKMVGIITSDDVFDIAEKETTEDIQKMAGITPLDDDDPFKISVWKMFLSRSIWLVVGIVLATVSQILLVVFFNAYDLGDLKLGQGKPFAAVFLLAPMIILIASVCGIIINQTTTSMVRVLSLKDNDRSDLLKLVSKEVLTAVLLAILCIVVNLVRLIIFYEAEFGSVNNSELWYAIAASSIALFIGIIFAAGLGTLLPIIANKFKLDPAIVSSPFTTTIIDMTTVAVFFGVGLAFF